MKAEWPNTLAEFAEGAIKINSRNHTRRLKKAQKGKTPTKPNTPIKKKEKTITEGGNAIDLDRGPDSKKSHKGEEVAQQ